MQFFKAIYKCFVFFAILLEVWWSLLYRRRNWLTFGDCDLANVIEGIGGTAETRSGIFYCLWPSGMSTTVLPRLLQWCFSACLKLLDIQFKLVKLVQMHVCCYRNKMKVFSRYRYWTVSKQSVVRPLLEFKHFRRFLRMLNAGDRILGVFCCCMGDAWWFSLPSQFSRIVAVSTFKKKMGSMLNLEKYYHLRRAVVCLCGCCCHLMWVLQMLHLTAPASPWVPPRIPMPYCASLSPAAGIEYRSWSRKE